MLFFGIELVVWKWKEFLEHGRVEGKLFLSLLLLIRVVVISMISSV